MDVKLTPQQPQEIITSQVIPMSQNPAAVYLAGLSAGSRRTMTQALQTMVELLTADSTLSYLDFPWGELRFQHTAALRARLQEKFQYNTVNKMLSALRGVLKTAWKLGWMTAEQYHTASSIESVKGESIPAGRSLANDELVALLQTCGQEATDVRDAAILVVLYGCGLRRAEVAALLLADYDQVAQTLRVKGKRNKERLVPVITGVANTLADWLTLRGNTPGALFVGLGNRNKGKALTTQAIYKMLQTRAKVAGIPPLSPHDFRRTFVGDLLDAGADIVTVQKLAGHASVETTSRYDRRGEKTKRKAAELLQVPYEKRTL